MRQTRVAFGGPDLPPRRLRDLLQEHVDAAPAGSRIDWATYYFRDRGLAEALIRATDRGVQVRLVVEASPRRPRANDQVIAMLSRHGLGTGLHLHRSGWWSPGHLHTKIYAFSEPRIAWIGSFNPSGDEPEDADVIAEIGDQDRGDNLLVALGQPELVDALADHVGALASSRSCFLDRARPSFNRIVSTPEWQLFFYPRMRTLIVEPELERLRRGDTVKAAISHLKSSPFTAALERAAARGAKIEFLVHDTERRVPTALVNRLSGAGIAIRRVGDADGLPMHAKFVIVERDGASAAWLGSYNYNSRSRYLNAELLARCADPRVIEALKGRFGAIASR